MACCLTAPSHYLNQCWLIINKVMWHSSEDIIIRTFEDTNQWSKIENYIYKMALRSPRGQWTNAAWGVDYKKRNINQWRSYFHQIKSINRLVHWLFYLTQNKLPTSSQVVPCKGKSNGSHVFWMRQVAISYLQISVAFWSLHLDLSNLGYIILHPVSLAHVNTNTHTHTHALPIYDTFQELCEWLACA